MNVYVNVILEDRDLTNEQLTPEQRHRTIKNIHSSDTSIEVRFRKDKVCRKTER